MRAKERHGLTQRLGPGAVLQRDGDAAGHGEGVRQQRQAYVGRRPDPLQRDHQAGVCHGPQTQAADNLRVPRGHTRPCASGRVRELAPPLARRDVQPASIFHSFMCGSRTQAQLQGQPDVARQVLADMLKDGVAPNRMTYEQVEDAHAPLRLVSTRAPRRLVAAWGQQQSARPLRAVKRLLFVEAGAQTRAVREILAA